jgi:hypothetical protein
MKKTTYYLLALIILFSCSKSTLEKIYQGKLDELIVGDFSLHLDSITKGVYNPRVIKEGEKELILTTKSANKFKGWAFVFSDPSTGMEVDRVEIPTEGPQSMKGGIFINIVKSKNQIFLINQYGDIGEYDRNGLQVRIISAIKDFSKSNEIEIPIARSKISDFRSPFIQLGLNPNSIINWKDRPGPGEMRSEFQTDFKEWILFVNLETQEVLTSNFPIPTGYEFFKNDFTATSLFGAFDSNRDLYYLCWPGSNEIYVLEGVDLVKKITPSSSAQFNFLPTEVIPWGDNFTVWALPKEASTNLFLMYDADKDLILKCSKLNESGAGETKFDRTKHYVLSVYSGDWDPLGEYFFDFESELDLENWFLTSEGLFINKPEQKSEDEYGFYKIDLSRFKN